MIVKILKAFIDPIILIICTILIIDALFPDWKYKKVKTVNKDYGAMCCWCSASWKAHAPGDWVNHASLYNKMKNNKMRNN